MGEGWGASAGTDMSSFSTQSQAECSTSQDKKKKKEVSKRRKEGREI